MCKVVCPFMRLVAKNEKKARVYGLNPRDGVGNMLTREPDPWKAMLKREELASRKAKRERDREMKEKRVRDEAAAAAEFERAEALRVREEYFARVRVEVETAELERLARAAVWAETERLAELERVRERVELDKQKAKWDRQHNEQRQRYDEKVGTPKPLKC